MSSFFISYSRIQEQVKGLAKDLEDMGHKVWVDKELTGGQLWWDQILHQIRACDVFIYAISPDTLKSEACKREFSYADSLNRPILPVKLGDISDKLLPHSVYKLQRVDYINAESVTLKSLVKAIGKLPKAPGLPKPLPQAPKIPMSYLGDLRERIEQPELNRDEQNSIYAELSAKAREDKDIDEIRELLKLFLARSYLFAIAEKNATALLESLSATTLAQPATSTVRQQGSKTNPIQEISNRVSELPDVPENYSGELRERIQQPLLSIEDQLSICEELSTKVENGDVADDIKDLVELLQARNDNYPMTEKILMELKKSLSELPTAQTTVSRGRDSVTTVNSAPTPESDLSSIVRKDVLNIDPENSENSVQRILDSVVKNGETWVIESDKINKITLTSDVVKKKRHLRAQLKCRDNLTDDKQKCLKELGWKTKETTANLAGGALACAAYATSGAALLALCSKKVRDYIMTFEATHEWTLSRRNGELSKITAELTRILGHITQNDLPLLAWQNADV